MLIALVSGTGEPTFALYPALFVVMLLSWAGLPVAGQAALVGAGVLAGRDRLEVEGVLAVGAAGSAAGGWLAYWLGRHGGRALWTMRGPFRHRRELELARGERLIAQHGALAVFLLPMWIAGVGRMAWRRFLVWNVITAVAWTLVAGLGGYLIGPPISRALGLANSAIVAAVVAVVGFALARVTRRGHGDVGRPVSRGGDRGAAHRDSSR
jgi:membrane protein DedA with SNARE-associated domain